MKRMCSSVRVDLSLEIQRVVKADLPIGAQHLVHCKGPQLPAVYRISAEVGGHGVTHHVHLHAELEQQSAQPIFVVCQCTPQGVHQARERYSEVSSVAR